MVPDKSLDVVKLIAALLCDVQTRHTEVFNTRALRLTVSKVRSRTHSEGIGFLTKTLPRLCKAFDKALAGGPPLNCIEYGFKPIPGTKLPRFLGELFSCVLQSDGTILQNPCANCVKDIRLLCYLFYKYELPYTDEQEQNIVQKFERTEDDLADISKNLQEIEAFLESNPGLYHRRSARLQSLQTASERTSDTERQYRTVRDARRLLQRVFWRFDPLDIVPRHGPGAVATKQRLWEKFQWTNVSDRITSVYPLDAYFYASQGAVCDSYDSFRTIEGRDLPARVCLVPKDSRGPRLISCEPVDFQWIQQGLGRAIVRHVERHPSTRWNVFFTDQGPNARGALLGSMNGKYSTLDLNEASDRVSLSLVRLLFPSDLYRYLSNTRSLSTELPSGKVLQLLKFAPMGSCLCFPILALTVWSLLTAAAPDADTREGILVYGDDVIVPTAYAENAMSILESFGLKINRDKSCTGGLFRESCGTDAFKGINVTPVRFRTVWSSTPSPEVYSSWIAYANSLWDRQCYRAYQLVVDALTAVYGSIPGKELNVSAPSLREAPPGRVPIRKRWNRSLQKVEYKVYDVSTPSVIHEMDGWSMLLRYFTEAARSSCHLSDVGRHEGAEPQQIKRHQPIEEGGSFSVSQYTKRKTSMLVKRWRCVR